MAMTRRPKRFFLDLETTGRDPASDHVLEVGLQGSARLDRLVSDAPEASFEALRVHGLDPVLCQVRGRPSAEILDELLAALGPGPLDVVAHNADFERAFLEAWAHRLDRDLPTIRWTCTYQMARCLVGKAPFRLRLGDLAGIFGWQTGALHRAGNDAALAERLWHALRAWEAIQAALRGKAPVLYVAGPLRGSGTPEVIAHNQTAMGNLCRWIQALLPETTLLVPHLNFRFLDESGPRGFGVREAALKACEALVARSDALLLCGETLTEGMARERSRAEALGLPFLKAPGWDLWPPLAADKIASPPHRPAERLASSRSA